MDAFNMSYEGFAIVYKDESIKTKQDINPLTIGNLGLDVNEKVYKLLLISQNRDDLKSTELELKKDHPIFSELEVKRVKRDIHDRLWSILNI